MDPPIHTANRRSEGDVAAKSFTFIDICGTISESRALRRSVNPGRSEPPPLTTMPAHSSRLMSVSHARIHSETCGLWRKTKDSTQRDPMTESGNVSCQQI
eukprot:scaffold112372_cov31-Tisochrysis_lutea.AAC.2